MALYINNKIEDKVKIQLIQFDITDDSEKIIKEIKVQVNEVINLEEYNGNNIKILEINKENVKISREAVRYKVLNQVELCTTEVEKYTETIVEDVKYGKLINIDINSSRPCEPLYEQPRYYYNIKFIK